MVKLIVGESFLSSETHKIWKQNYSLDKRVTDFHIQEIAKCFYKPHIFTIQNLRKIKQFTWKCKLLM